MARSKALVAATLSLALLGCAPRVETHGVSLEPEQIAQIRLGVDDRLAVAERFGSPSSISVFDDRTWYYVGDRDETIAFLERDITERSVVAIRFDDKGVVQKVDAFGLERGREVEIVERETPSFGESVNPLQQMLGNLGRFNRNEEPGAGGGVPGGPPGGR